MPARNITENYIQATFTLTDYIKTRNIYEDNMLLQRNKPAYIDGVCQNINSATAYLYKNEDTAPIQTKTVTVDGNEWNVTFDAVSDYTATYKIVIDGDNGSTQMNNVLFGDVFLFTGQSNMWKEVSYYKNTDSDYTQANVEKHLTDKIRVMYTKGSGTYGDTDLQYDAKSKDNWRDFSTYANVSPLPAAVFSAATEIYENNDNIPIGVIANAYPGSYISCWFPNMDIDSCNTNRNKSFVERNWYNGRIYPIRNLKLSGIFWYQGESDAASAYSEEHASSGYPTEQYAYYKHMLKTLIDDWRNLFGDEKLPFYWVQLTRLGSGTTDENNPDIGSDPETTVKKAQTDVYLEAEDKTNLGVIGTLDLYGRYERPETANNANCRDDIHPGQKWLVGGRMANYALRDIYGKGVSVSGPMPKSAKVVGNTVTVAFDCTGKLSLMPKTQYADTTTDEKITNGEIAPDKLNEFRLAGEDKVWYAADAEIASDNTVSVTSADVSSPKYVSYAAKNDYPEAPNLTDDTGLPSYVFEIAVDEADAPPINDDKCVKITAEYNADGSLKDITTEEINVSEIEPVENTPTHKVFYWESLNSMKPVKSSAKPTTKPTTPPTDEPDADYTFKFGTDQITSDTLYAEQSDGMTYGFVGMKDSIIDGGRFDGFTYEQGDAVSILKNGSNFVEADYSAYDEETTNKMGEGEIPVRFAMKAKKGGYYTVTATVVNTSETDSAEVSRFSEVRHFILYHKTLAPKESITKTFNVHLADVYVSSEGGKVEDDVINVSVSGRNAGLKSVSIKENEQKGKTIWCMTDSTGADQFTNVPYFGLQNYGGTGQVLSKYINPEIAVSNQGEGGLDATDTVHFNNALEQMKSGDYLYIQYGFNDVKDKAVYKKRLEKYYTAAHEKGVKTILTSPTERQNTSANWDGANKKWTASNGIFAEAGKEFVDEKIAAGANDIAFVDVNTAFVNWMNEAMGTMLAQRNKAGFDDTEASTRLMEYYFRIGWTFGRDSVHINEAGADNAGYLFAREAKKIIADNPSSVQAKVLSELMENSADYTPYSISDKIIANGYAPNASYPYPNTKSVELQYPTMVKSADTSNGRLNSMTVKVQGNMDKYALGVAEIINENGETVKTIYTKSTNKNSAIGHIDNTACEYGEIVTMYFDESENMLDSGYSYKAYVLPIENGADKPDSEPRYSSIYTVPAEVIDKLITSQDGNGSEMFDYAINNGDTIKDQGANSASGATAWQLVGSATAQTFEKTVKDKLTAAHLYTNANGTFTPTKFFNGGKTVSNGKIHLHFQLNHTYGQFGIKLTTSTKAASSMNGMQILTVNDGLIKLYDGTEAGEVKGGKWTDVDVWIDLDRYTEEISIGGGDKVSCRIDKLDTSDKNALTSFIPIRGMSIALSGNSGMATAAFDAYITDLSVSTVENDTPKINVTAAVDSECTAMGSVSGGGNYDIHSDVTLTAVPNKGYNLSGWYTEEGELYSTEKVLTIERIRADIALTAKFVIQRGKDSIASFEINTDKATVKKGSTITLSPVNCTDSEGYATEAVTSSDIVWSCKENGISISTNGVMTVTSDFDINDNAVKTVTVSGMINGITAQKTITVYSYAYYDVISQKSDYDGKIGTLADKTAILWGGGGNTSKYVLSEKVTLDKDTQIKYSNAFSNNGANKNRYINFKDSSGNTVLSMYYFWADIYADANNKISAFAAIDKWSDIVINIEVSTGKVTVSRDDNTMQITIDKSKLTNISSIELVSASGCPDRPLGISEFVITQGE